MGGKNKQPAPPTEIVMPPSFDQDLALMGMMAQMMSMAAMHPPAPPSLPPVPEIYTGPDVDWEEKNKQLANKAKADYNTEAAAKVGRAKTILTSPLLDEEEPVTTASLGK